MISSTFMIMRNIYSHKLCNTRKYRLKSLCNCEICILEGLDMKAFNKYVNFKLTDIFNSMNSVKKEIMELLRWISVNEYVLNFGGILYFSKKEI